MAPPTTTVLTLASSIVQPAQISPMPTHAFLHVSTTKPLQGAQGILLLLMFLVICFIVAIAVVLWQTHSHISIRRQKDKIKSLQRKLVLPSLLYAAGERPSSESMATSSVASPQLGFFGRLFNFRTFQIGSTRSVADARAATDRREAPATPSLSPAIPAIVVSRCSPRVSNDSCSLAWPYNLGLSNDRLKVPTALWGMPQCATAPVVERPQEPSTQSLSKEPNLVLNPTSLNISNSSGQPFQLRSPPYKKSVGGADSRRGSHPSRRDKENVYPRDEATAKSTRVPLSTHTNRF